MMAIIEERYPTDSSGVNRSKQEGVEQENVEQENVELETSEVSPDRSLLLPEQVTEERVRQAILEAESLPPLPVQLIGRYARLAAQRGRAEQLDDGSWYADIRSVPGVWAQSDSEEGVLRELELVVRDWVLLKIQDKDRDLPEIDTINLNVL